MSELRTFVIARAGERGWARITEGLGLGDRCYLPVGAYPDAEAERLIAGIGRHLSLDEPTLLRAFGRHLVRPWLETFGPLDPRWKTLDVLENCERVIHSAVRRRARGARPPTLIAARSGPGEVVLQYRSARRLCHLGTGIVEGLAETFSEAVEVSQRRCMLDGDPECQVVVRASRAPG